MNVELDTDQDAAKIAADAVFNAKAAHQRLNHEIVRAVALSRAPSKITLKPNFCHFAKA
ncbi:MULTISPECIES: hypothetical protein [unclassified Rhizobium]|uniref:hypothetical protein n=1 Tax=unclassified Rhizobium TaxID=2613769 RepID=UPI001620D67B|nr:MULTISPECIES: hypothetical protein [unclassified Rhizobium]MBB3320388.1 hypothetical protein [Rhizobium sp. BK181]MCS4096245.1 hypothetical protein [Rhizobium sp. BK176]